MSFGPSSRLLPIPVSTFPCCDRPCTEVAIADADERKTIGDLRPGDFAFHFACRTWLVIIEDGLRLATPPEIERANAGAIRIDED